MSVSRSEAADQATIYQLDGYRFSTALPGVPTSIRALGEREAHLVIGGRYGGPVPPEHVGRVETPRPAISLSRRAIGVADLPASPMTGSWSLATLAGFQRVVAVHRPGATGARYWWELESLFRGRVSFFVTAEDSTYGAVRAFAESFQPIS